MRVFWQLAALIDRLTRRYGNTFREGQASGVHGLVLMDVPPPVANSGPLTDAETGLPVPADYEG